MTTNPGSGIIKIKGSQRKKVDTLQTIIPPWERIMKHFGLLSVISVFAIVPSILYSSTIIVPDDYPKIQEAVNAAVDGDTVLVSPGTYVENIDFIGKALTVKSSKGAAVTTIDGGRNGSVVSFSNGEGNGSVLEGFTITNGSGTFSGPYTYGGGIYCWFSTPTITGNIIKGNTVNYHGGGIYCISADSFSISYNTICNNKSNNGGGIYCSAGSNPIISFNIIYGNDADLDGGGLYCNFDSNPLLVNNSICSNTAGYGGGGIYSYGSSPVVINSILWDNRAPNGSEAHLADWLYPSMLRIAYSDVEGGMTSIHVQPQCILIWGNGMIDTDPAFVLAGKRDHRLLWGSPCIDTGHPDLLDGDGTQSDIGCFFFDQGDHLTLYLTPDPITVPQGGELGVTYTLINRWEVPETFWLQTTLFFPNGDHITLFGPEEFTFPGEHTGQVHIEHAIPPRLPAGDHQYWSILATQGSAILDLDMFHFRVKKNPVTHKVPVEW